MLVRNRRAASPVDEEARAEEEAGSQGHFLPHPTERESIHSLLCFFNKHTQFPMRISLATLVESQYRIASAVFSTTISVIRCSVTSRLTKPSTQSTPYTNGTTSLIGFFSGEPASHTALSHPLYWRITLSLITFCSFDSQFITSRSVRAYASRH